MQQKANMTVLGVSSTAEIVTVVNFEAKWQAVIVQDGKVLYRFGTPCDTKEDALEVLLGLISNHMYHKLKDQFV
jgi:hypothetical protein